MWVMVPVFRRHRNIGADGDGNRSRRGRTARPYRNKVKTVLPDETDLRFVPGDEPARRCRSDPRCTLGRTYQSHRAVHRLTREFDAVKIAGDIVVEIQRQRLRSARRRARCDLLGNRQHFGRRQCHRDAIGARRAERPRAAAAVSDGHTEIEAAAIDRLAGDGTICRQVQPGRQRTVGNGVAIGRSAAGRNDRCAIRLIRFAIGERFGRKRDGRRRGSAA